MLEGGDPGGRAFDLFLRPHPGAFRQLICPHPGEFGPLEIPGGGGGAKFFQCIIFFSVKVGCRNFFSHVEGLHEFFFAFFLNYVM